MRVAIDSACGLGHWLTPEQGRRLLESAAPSSARKVRDHAMVAMLIGCGPRRAELLAVESIQQREEHWVIADLVGKGGHVRTVPIPPLGDEHGGRLVDLGSHLARPSVPSDH